MWTEGANTQSGHSQWANRSSNKGNGSTQTPPSPGSPGPAGNELRLVLLGRTGAGKSATGNTILRGKRFDDELSMSSVTKECRRESAVVEERQLALVDTPGFFDTDLTEEELTQEVMHCLALSSPGPHAFLLVVPIERYTEEQQNTVKKILEMFHEDISRHTVLVFSHADKLQGKSIESFISGQKQRIQDLVERFGSRFVAFDNMNVSNPDQVKRLLAKVDELLVENESRCFSNKITEVLNEAQRIIDEKMAERERKIKEDVKKIADGRWSAFSVSLEEERRKTELRKTTVQNNIRQIEAKIKTEELKLRQSRANLRKELENMRRLWDTAAQEELERMDREETERKELDIWTQEEERRRLGEAERANKNLNKIVAMLSMFLLGLGAGYAPLLLAFIFPAAPVVEVGLSADILAKLLGFGSAGGGGLIWKAVGVGAPAAMKLAMTQCSIQ